MKKNIAISDRIDNSEIFEKIKRFLKTNKSFSVFGSSGAVKTLTAGSVASSGRKLLIITESEQSALKYRKDLITLFSLKAEVFPCKESSVYDGNPPDLYKYAEQIRILQNFSDIDVVIMPLRAISEKFPNSEYFEKNSIEIKPDDTVDTEKLGKYLIEAGYKKAVTVADIGEFSIRGDTVDIYSLAENPVRLELWGDTVTDLRYFNPETQRSINKTDSVKIMPVSKFMRAAFSYFEKVTEKPFKDYIKTHKGEDIEFMKEKYSFIKEQISENIDFEGINYFESVFNPDLKIVTELLPQELIIVFDEYSELKNKYKLTDDNLKQKYEANLKLPMTLPLPKYAHTSSEEFFTTSASRLKIFFDNFVAEPQTGYSVDFNSQPAPFFSGNTAETAVFIEEKRNSGMKIIIASDYAERVKEILSEFEIPYSIDSDEPGTVLLTDSLTFGGTVCTTLNLTILTDRELFNKRSSDITVSKKILRRQKTAENFSEFLPGDYVVHGIHGIGIFRGLSKQVIDDTEKDYLTIEYAGKDKLYVPAEQINFLCAYKGSGSVKPTLSRMGGNDWTNIKSKVKKAMEDTAQSLLRLYADRKSVSGYAFEQDSVWQYELEDSFPYTETTDQMKAISETKADMELDKPMDRLICGDVGFGKTEVAIRAMFKAVMSGKQAAMIVPTTVLAMQHYETVSERFKPFPVKTAVLSRFKSKKEIADILEKTAAGEIDIIIGTHRLIQDDVFFKDLGLLVIDEEHKFGVNHKEKFKMLKSNLDVLNMSATPIPRTLYMALSGIRDISVIATPPVNRLPVKTFVGEYSDTLVRNAVNYEIEREGQVFYLYNRVETINDFAVKLQNLVPNARIAAVHGKTDGTLLEKTMCDFREGKFDILLCSAIIESGLDIPNANTMIIHDADRFGLAQLYQLRGRVGRTDRQAYCYCLYKGGKQLTEDAVKRLSAVKQFTTFGSGYQIALRDIEIRGIGNILGTKQHGKMVTVGFDTYCSLLEETLDELRGIKKEKTVSSIVDLNVTAYIPDEWVGSEEQKAAVYKSLAEVKTEEELNETEQEWKDRFSVLGKPAENLIKLIKIKLAASRAGINFIRETPVGIRIYTDYSPAEQRIVYARIKGELRKYIKFAKMPKACTEGNSVILFDNRALNFDELFNILSDLFYDIFRIKSEYMHAADGSGRVK